MSENTRHHYVYCAVHKPLIDGKLQPCTCGVESRPAASHTEPTIFYVQRCPKCGAMWKGETENVYTGACPDCGHDCATPPLAPPSETAVDHADARKSAAFALEFPAYALGGALLANLARAYLAASSPSVEREACPSGLCDGSGVLEWEEYGATKTAPCQACRLKSSRLASPSPSAPEPRADPNITDSDRLDAIARVINATQEGVQIHDATDDWAVVVVHEAQVCGRGATLRDALDEMVREDIALDAVLKSNGVPEGLKLRDGLSAQGGA